MNSNIPLCTIEGKELRVRVDALLAQPCRNTLMSLIDSAAETILPRSQDDGELPVAVGVASEVKVEACSKLTSPTPASAEERFARHLLYLLGRVFPADCQMPAEILPAEYDRTNNERQLASSLWRAAQGAELGLTVDDLLAILLLVGRILIRCGYGQPSTEFPTDAPLDQDDLIELVVVRLLHRRPERICERVLRYYAEIDPLVDRAFHDWAWLEEIDWTKPPSAGELSVLKPLLPAEAPKHVVWKTLDEAEAEVAEQASPSPAGNGEPAASKGRLCEPLPRMPGAPRLQAAAAEISILACANATKTSTMMTAIYHHRAPSNGSSVIVAGQKAQAFYKRHEADWHRASLPRTDGDREFLFDVRSEWLNLGLGNDRLPLRVFDFDGKDHMPETFGPRRTQREHESDGLIVIVNPDGFLEGGAALARADATWLQRRFSQAAFKRGFPVAVVLCKADRYLSEQELVALGRTHLLPTASDPRLLAGYASRPVDRLSEEPSCRLRRAALEFNGNNRFLALQTLIEQFFACYGDFLREVTRVTPRIQIFLTMTQSPAVSQWQRPHGVEEVFQWLADQLAPNLKSRFSAILKEEYAEIRRQQLQLSDFLKRLDWLRNRRRLLERKKEKSVGRRPLWGRSGPESIDKGLAATDVTINELLTLAERSVGHESNGKAPVAQRQAWLEVRRHELQLRRGVLEEAIRDMVLHRPDRFWRRVLVAAAHSCRV